MYATSLPCTSFQNPSRYGSMPGKGLAMGGIIAGSVVPCPDPGSRRLARIIHHEVTKALRAGEPATQRKRETTNGHECTRIREIIRAYSCSFVADFCVDLTNILAVSTRFRRISSKKYIRVSTYIAKSFQSKVAAPANPALRQ